RRAEARVVRRDGQIARGDEPEPAGKRGAVHARDDRLAQARKVQEQPGVLAPRVVGGHRSRLRRLAAQIGARAEGLLAGSSQADIVRTTETKRSRSRFPRLYLRQASISGRYIGSNPLSPCSSNRVASGTSSAPAILESVSRCGARSPRSIMDRNETLMRARSLSSS